MRLLLDTNVFLWAQLAPERLGDDVVLFEGDDHEIFVSAVTAWEIAIKHRTRKLALPEPPETYVPDSIRAIRARPLAISHEHALAVARLPDLHCDPFDRLLVAQAMIEDAALMTSDRRLAAYPAQTIVV